LKKKDYYKVLGVSRDADSNEIKRAYRRLARKYHPDVNPNDKNAEAKFKEITEAYEVLIDPRKRAEYDQFGFSGIPGGGFGRGFSGFPGFDFDDFFRSDFGDIFDIFSSRKGRRSERGADLVYNLEISLEESAFGTETFIEIPHTKKCSNCKGSGAQPGTTPRSCPACGGTGEIRHAQSIFGGTIIRVTVCNKCYGSKNIIDKPCQRCNGSGKENYIKRLKVKIPAGVNTGYRIRIPHEGKEGNPTGDLYIVISVKPHKIFERHGTELLCEVSIPFIQAILGAEVEVPTLEGKAKLRIPPGTQPNTIFRLRGKGIPYLKGPGRGDQHVRIKVTIPSKLTSKQRDILEQYAKVSNIDIEKKESIFKRAKKRFWG
jgi:molecular chaperone DnaJ